MTITEFKHLIAKLPDSNQEVYYLNDTEPFSVEFPHITDKDYYCNDEFDSYIIEKGSLIIE